ncbi:MAG: recombination regulator RecX [Chlorobiaceae bacterium]
MTDSNTPSAMAFALKLLGLRNHSNKELERKLRKKGYETESIEPVLEKLTQQGVLDDRVFAMELIRSRSRRKPAGKLKIGMELRKRGVSEAIIGELLKEYDSTELCYRAAEKKVASLHNATDAERKRKLEVFLNNRGFEWQEIQTVLKQLHASSTDFEEPC